MSIINPSLASGILYFVSKLINTNRGKLRTPIFERYYKDILPIYMNTHRETLSTLFFLTLFLFTPTLALAIPTGIQGFAASAGVNGGQGGQSIVVTNLNSSGSGSLRSKIEASGTRYITFAAGLNGTINFTGTVNILNDNITVDGSGHNITISGGQLGIRSRNVVIHNLTFADTTNNVSAIYIDQGGRDTWIDHNTFRANNINGVSFGQGISIYPLSFAANSGTGITISWNRFTQPNKKAFLIGANVDGMTQKVSIHHNWFEGITSRSPRIHHTAIIHYWNNYCNGWGEYCLGSGDRPDVLVENNIFDNSHGGLATVVAASYANDPSKSVNASGNLLLGSPSPVIQTRGTFPRSLLGYSVTPEVANDALKQRVTQCVGARMTACGTPADTQPPTVSMTAPANVPVPGSSVTVSANASDNVGVSGVQFKLDDANLGAEVTTAPYSVTWKTAAGSHMLTAVARDAAGNSTTSASVSVTVGGITPTLPTVKITDPPSDATVMGAVEVSATRNDAGTVQIAGVQFKLDGANLGAEDTTAPYSVTWDSRTAAFGSHTLTAVARSTGNTTSSPVRVNVDNSDPFLPDVIVTSLSYASGVFTSTVKNQGTIATPADKVIGVGYSVDGVVKTWGAVSGPLAAGASVTIGTDGGPYTIPNGTHTITANVDDNKRFAESLETNNVFSRPITVGNQAPTVSVTAPANGTTVSGSSVVVSANASDDVGVSGVQFKLDGANLGAEDTTFPYSVTWNSTAAAVGSHTLTAVARDAAGNTTASAAVSVTVPDVTPPTVSITAPANGAPVSGTSVTVSANASDNVGVDGVQFKLDGANLGAEDTTAPYSIVWNSTTATIGSHTLTAIARDAARNIGTSAGVTVTVKSGPISLWKFDESSGTTASDASGANTATLSGGASFTAGRLGNALKLNGIDGQAKANMTTGLNLTSALTIAAWIKPTSLPSSGYSTVAVKGRDLALGRGYGLNIHNGNLNFAKVGSTNVRSTVAVPTGAFHHVAVTWDALAGQVKFYLDGTLAQTVSNATAIVSSLDSDPLTIGSWLTGGAWCNGLLDDVRIYNRALSTTEVATLATPPAPGTTPLSVSITAPASGATVSGTSVTVSATGPSVPTGSVSPEGLGAPGRIRLLASPVSNAAAEGKP